VRELTLLLVIAAPAASKAEETNWKLVWNDEFDGSSIDSKKWDFDLGNGFYAKDSKVWIGGWGNDELQYYTKEPENAYVKDGALHIRAMKKAVKGFKYTSARLKTCKQDGSELFAKKYGKFEFRAKLPTGKGIWPALWMLPHHNKYGGWPRSGEIDVMEARGQEPTKVLGTLHYGTPWPNNTHTGTDYILPNAGSITDWHVYAVDWEPGEFRWSVDGRQYAKQNFWWSPKADGSAKKVAGLHPWPAPFDQPFHIIVNVAVGGRFLGNPDESTRFPVEMHVDYVRVYDKEGGYGPTKPRGPGRLPKSK
jgi:beta-glucanase (GH16 family)